MKFEQYYPTPPALARQLVGMLNNREYRAMALEPSAGTGELVKEYCRTFDCESRSIHCIEINAERAAVLRDKHYMVVWDDFLTFEPLMPYSKIIMNPPFHAGAKHLLKALRILSDGGEIACILNAETLKNPFSRERQDLIRQLENLEEYRAEFVKSAFETTDVKVALVYGRKTKSKIICPTLEKFKTYKVNSKVIIPLYAFSSWDGRFTPTYMVDGILSDIEKVMSYLDCGRINGGYSMREMLNYAEKVGQNKNIDTKYFIVTLYKKGTCHLTFKSAELLKKFNLYCGRKHGWLPDGYGRKAYSDLNAEEKAVADSFEGKESYEETYKNQQYYFPESISNIKLLGAGNIE